MLSGETGSDATFSPVLARIDLWGFLIDDVGVIEGDSADWGVGGGGFGSGNGKTDSRLRSSRYISMNWSSFISKSSTYTQKEEEINNFRLIYNPRRFKN